MKQNMNDLNVLDLILENVLGLKNEQREQIANNILSKLFSQHPLFAQVKHVFHQYPHDHQDNLTKLLGQNSPQQQAMMQMLLQQATVFKQFQDQQKYQLEFQLSMLQNRPENTPTKFQVEDEFDDFKDAKNLADEFDQFEVAHIDQQPSTQPVSVSEQFRQSALQHVQEDNDFQEYQQTLNEKMSQKQKYDAFLTLDHPVIHQTHSIDQQQSNSQTNNMKMKSQSVEDDFEFQTADVVENNLNGINQQPKQLKSQSVEDDFEFQTADVVSNTQGLNYQSKLPDPIIKNEISKLDHDEFELYKDNYYPINSPIKKDQQQNESNIEAQLSQSQTKQQQSIKYDDIEWPEIQETPENPANELISPNKETVHQQNQDEIFDHSDKQQPQVEEELNQQQECNEDEEDFEFQEAEVIPQNKIEQNNAPPVESSPIIMQEINEFEFQSAEVKPTFVEIQEEHKSPIKKEDASEYEKTDMQEDKIDTFEQSSQEQASALKYTDIEWPEIEDGSNNNNLIHLLGNFQMPSQPPKQEEINFQEILSSQKYDSFKDRELEETPKQSEEQDSDQKAENLINEPLDQDDHEFEFQEAEVTEIEDIKFNQNEAVQIQQQQNHDSEEDEFEFQEAEVQIENVQALTRMHIYEANFDKDQTSNENENLDTIQEEPTFKYVDQVGTWRESINKIIGLDIENLDEMIMELEQLELGMYSELIREYRRLILDLNDLKLKKQIAIDNEEFELLVPIRDSIRMKDPIAAKIKQQIHFLASAVNALKGRTLSEVVYNYIIEFGLEQKAEVKKEKQCQFCQELKQNIGIQDPLKYLMCASSKPVLQKQFAIKLDEELKLVGGLVDELRETNLKKESKYIQFVRGVEKLLQMSDKEHLQIAEELQINLKDIERDRQIFEGIIQPYLTNQKSRIQGCPLCCKFMMKDEVSYKEEFYHVACLNFYLNRVSTQI